MTSDLRAVYRSFLVFSGQLVQATYTKKHLELITLDGAIVSLNLPKEKQKTWHIHQTLPLNNNPNE